MTCVASYKSIPTDYKLIRETSNPKYHIQIKTFLIIIIILYTLKVDNKKCFYITNKKKKLLSF